ncbi:MAG: hypothetical protein WCL19_04035 [Verrucomicrobiota bacterium]
MKGRIGIHEDANQRVAEVGTELGTQFPASLPPPPLGADDSEADRRDFDMDSGDVDPISHAEFVREVGLR